MIKKVEGIILSTVDYKESSKIINIFTKEDGIIGVLAKGSKNLKNKLAATTSTLTYGNFHLRQYGNGIPLLTEVDVIDAFKQIRKDIVKQNYALFLIELASQVYRHDEERQVYELLIQGLNKLNEGYDSQIITNIVELKLLEFLGIKPSVERCVNCGSADNIITISSYKGGYLCKNCVKQEFIYQLKTIKLIRMFYMIDLSKVTKIDVSEPIKKEIGLFIDDYYERYSGLYLKSKNFLQEFSKLNI